MVFIGGDFYNRVGTQNDFIIENEKDLNYLPQDYYIGKKQSEMNTDSRC